MRNAETMLRRRYDRHDWESIGDGYSGATVYRLTGPSALFVKLAPWPVGPDTGGDPTAEADRLRWLAANGVPAPEPWDAGVIGDTAFLVSAGLPGRSAAEPWPEPVRAAVVDAVADFAVWLHSLPVDGCPFTRDVPVILAQSSEAVARDDSGDRRAVLDRTATLAAGLTEGAEALCHGDFCLPNVLLDPDSLAVTGVVDVGRFGRSDPYADLALVTRSLADHRLNPQYGPEYARRFLRRYGADPVDSDRIDLFRSLDALL
ncbi:phosphotransferase [Stackebrandtia albiflava]|nr:phosphotransferase [Stackebrandtia albiflava]